MAGNPLVSINTPTRNRQHFLPLIYECVKAQHMSDFEWLVLDDSPSPSDFMTALADPRVIYRHSSQPLTIGMKRNILIEQARGEIIANFDDDDFYAKHYLLDMLRAMFEEKASFVKLDSFFIFSKVHGIFAHCDLCQHVGPHYVLGNEPVQLVNFDDSNNVHLRGSVFGYGFSFMYRKSVWNEVRCPDLDWREDAVFAEGAMERFGMYGVADMSFICLHILHSTNTSRCFVQKLLPSFLLETLFPNSVDHVLFGLDPVSSALARGT